VVSEIIARTDTQARKSQYVYSTVLAGAEKMYVKNFTSAQAESGVTFCMTAAARRHYFSNVASEMRDLAMLPRPLICSPSSLADSCSAWSACHTLLRTVTNTITPLGCGINNFGSR